MASAHQTALSVKHQTLEARIAAEARRPLPDNERLRQLKREKLRLKEELVGLQ